MKLLFDANLSSRLPVALADLFPGSRHVRDMGLGTSDDEPIWQYARDQGFTIVTKDSDFNQRALVRGQPPKVLWVRLGNCTTSEVEAVLRGGHDAILSFAEDPKAALLVLD